MSEIIKPDAKMFQSAKRFQKEPFRVDPLSPLKEIAPMDIRLDGMAPEPEPPAPEQLLEEVRSKVARLIEEAENRAQQITSEAEERAEDIFRQARERGRVDGVEEVRDKVERQRQASSQILASFVERMKEREAELIESLTPRLADLAAELAQKIIHREIGRDPSLVTAQAEQAIVRILQREKIVIRVNCDDEKLMKEHKPTLLGMFDGVDKIEVIIDPEVERGGCVVETDLIKVDARPSSQLRTACRTILGEEEK